MKNGAQLSSLLLWEQESLKDVSLGEKY